MDSSVEGPDLTTSQNLSLLVDELTLGKEEVEYLLSFEGTQGFRLGRLREVREQSNGVPVAVLSYGGSPAHHAMEPLPQFRRVAEGFLAESYGQEPLVRAMVLGLLAAESGADALVSPVGPAFVDSPGMLSSSRIFSVGESLAVMGAFLRKRPKVPLGGTPPLIVDRTDAYRSAVRAVVPASDRWWRSCVASFSGSDRFLQLAQTVLRRAGQALRGRDGVHESFRVLDGRAAVVDGLHHSDVVFTSCVASLDALARLVDALVGVDSDRQRIGWQKDWRKQLKKSAPELAEIANPRKRLGAALQLITRVRNGIHSVAADEYLYANRSTGTVEHRVMLSSEFAEGIMAGSDALGSLEPYGLFLYDNPPTINAARLVEQTMAWLGEILEALLQVMLMREELIIPGTPRNGDPVESRIASASQSLTRVGQYPVGQGKGQPASRPTRRRIMGAIHRAERKLKGTK